MIDDPRPTVLAVDDFTRQLRMRGRGTDGGAGGGGQGLLVDMAAATGGGRGRWRRAAKAVAEGEEQCQNGVWCVLYCTLLGKASKIWKVVRKSIGSC